MKVYNESKTQILTEYDERLGTLKPEVDIIHHKEVPYVEEQGHYEVVKEYANGGKDIEWVVDVKGQEHVDAYDEEEQIFIYIPFTEKEIQDIEFKKELQEIQQWFLDNDWKVNKIITKEWSETDERWIEYLMERSVKRARQDFINEELEGM